jgi:phosphoglycolate phosphatase
VNNPDKNFPIKFKETENILWDWNGTLLNDVDVNLKVINRMLSRRGLKQLYLASYKNTFCFPVKLFYEQIGIDLEKESFGEAAEEYISDYRSCEDEIGLNANASFVLDAFHQKGIRQYILSACGKEDLMRMINRFDLAGKFQEIYGADDIHAHGKTETGKILIQNHSIDPERTLLIGDTLHDAEVAKAIGINYILYSGGHNSYDLLNKESRVITDLKEILTLLRCGSST